MKVCSFLIKRSLSAAATETVDPAATETVDPEGWKVPLAWNLARGGEEGKELGLQGLSKYVHSVPTGELSPNLIEKLKGALNAKNVPFFPTKRHLGGWLPSWGVSLAKKYPGIRALLEARLGGSTDELLQKAHPEKGIIFGSRSPAVIAHELGHASGISPHGNVLWGLPSQIGRAVGPSAGMFYAGYKANPEDNFFKTLGKGALRGSATSLLFGSPVLLEEARASLRGLRGLKAIGHPIGPSSKFMGAAGLTYLLSSGVSGATYGALGASVGRWLGRRKLQRILEEKQKKTQATAVPVAAGLPAGQAPNEL